MNIDISVSIDQVLEQCNTTELKTLLEEISERMDNQFVDHIAILPYIGNYALVDEIEDRADNPAFIEALKHYGYQLKSLDE